MFWWALSDDYLILPYRPGNSLGNGCPIIAMSIENVNNSKPNFGIIRQLRQTTRGKRQ